MFGSGCDVGTGVVLAWLWWENTNHRTGAVAVVVAGVAMVAPQKDQWELVDIE